MLALFRTMQSILGGVFLSEILFLISSKNVHHRNTTDRNYFRKIVCHWRCFRKYYQSVVFCEITEVIEIGLSVTPYFRNEIRSGWKKIVGLVFCRHFMNKKHLHLNPSLSIILVRVPRFTVKWGLFSVTLVICCYCSSNHSIMYFNKIISLLQFS